MSQLGGRLARREAYPRNDADSIELSGVSSTSSSKSGVTEEGEVRWGVTVQEDGALRLLSRLTREERRGRGSRGNDLKEVVEWFQDECGQTIVL